MGWCPQCVGPVPLESAAGAAHTGRCWSDPEGGVMPAPVSEGEAVRRGSEVRLPRLIVHIMDDVTLALGSVLLLGVIGFLIAFARDSARRGSAALEFAERVSLRPFPVP